MGAKKEVYGGTNQRTLRTFIVVTVQKKLDKTKNGDFFKKLSLLYLFPTKKNKTNTVFFLADQMTAIFYICLLNVQ